MMSFDQFRTRYAAQIDELYLRAGAAKWRIPEGQWAAALYSTATTIDSEIRRPGDMVPGAIDFSSLHADDFAFALAFRLGCQKAMDYFRSECTPRIGCLAAEITQDAGRATGLVKTVLQRLEGYERQDGCRKTLFEYFDGRVPLEDWLRSLMVRPNANELREKTGSTKPCPPPVVLAAYDSLIRPGAARSQGRPLGVGQRDGIRRHLRECSTCQSRLVAIQQGDDPQGQLEADPDTFKTRQHRTWLQLCATLLAAAAVIGVLGRAIWVSEVPLLLSFRMTDALLGSSYRQRADPREILHEDPSVVTKTPVVSASQTPESPSVMNGQGTPNSSKNETRWVPTANPSSAILVGGTKAPDAVEPRYARPRSTYQRTQLEILRSGHTTSRSHLRRRPESHSGSDSRNRNTHSSSSLSAGKSSAPATQAVSVRDFTSAWSTSSALPPGEAHESFSVDRSVEWTPWRSAGPNSTNGACQPQFPVQPREASLARPIIIVSEDQLTRWRLTPGGVIARSADSVHWQPLHSGVNIDLVAGAAPSAEVCWVVGAGGTVLLTVDGEQWEKMATPTAADLESIWARDEYSAKVMAIDGRSFETSDGGRNWRPSQN